MANTPNENDPKSNTPKDEADLPPLPEGDAADEVRIENLPDLGPVDLAELSGDIPPDEQAHEGEVWSERAPQLDPPHDGLPDFAAGPDLPSPVKDPSSFTEAGLVDLPDLADAAENDSANLFRPPANPVPPPVEVIRGPDSAVGTPVAPASGWFDANELNRLPDAKLGADAPLSDSDLFGSPPNKTVKADALLQFIEGSDIFSGGPAPDADLAATSDVLLGAALDYAADNNLPLPPEPPRGESPSELPLGVMPAPDSEPVLEVVPPELGSGSKPAFEDDSLFDGLDSDAPVPTDHFSSGDALAPLPPDTGSPEAEAHAPTKPQKIKPLGPNDTDLRELGLTPDFGATPRATPDASSILADLSNMGAERYDGASEVRLDAPEFDRTVGGDNDGSEFGLELPPEMREGPQAPDSASIVWSVQPGEAEGEVSHDAGTVPEVALDDDADLMAPPKKPLDRTEPVSTLPSAADEGDSSVEFSDFPSAEDESTASQFFGKITPDRGKLPATEEHPVPPVDEVMPAEWAATTSSAEIDLPELDDEPPARGSKPAIAGLAGTQIRRPTPAPGELSPAAGETGPIPSLPKGSPKSPSKSGEPSTASVEIDWVSGSMPQMPVSATGSSVGPVAVANWGAESMVQRGPAAPAAPEPPTEEYAEPARGDSDDGLYTRQTKPDLSVRPEPRRGGKGGWLGGTLVGAVLAGGGFAGAYFGGFLPPPGTTAQVAPPGSKKGGGDAGDADAGPKGSAGHADVTAAVRAGDAATAKKIAGAIKDPSPAAKAAQGEAELFAVVQENKDSAATTIAPTSPGMKAAAAKLQAAITELEKVKTPEAERAAVKATLQLGVVYQLGGEENRARRLYTDAKGNYAKYASTFDAALDRLDESRAPVPPAMPDGSSRRVLPPDAREVLLAAVILLQDEPPAAKEEDVEAGVYFWKAVRLAKTEKYAEAIELIGKAKAKHVKQARAAAGQGLNPLSDPLEQIFPRSCDDLKAFWELQAAIAENKTVAEAFQKDGAAKALADLEKKAAGAVKLMTDLKDATEKLTTASKELKDATDKVEKLAKEFKEAEEAKVAVEKKLEAEEKGRKGAEEVVMGVVKELQAAKLLPEKYDTAELLAAQKRALDRATGPALSSLLSSEMMAVAGFGLTAGQLVDIADRLARAEAAAKTATEKLAAEVKKLTAEHGEAMKKLADEHATAVSKLKDDQTAELKKAADAYAADAKKLTDGFEAKVKALDAAVAAEKKRTDEIAAKFKADLGNAVTPAQAIDLWLPLLVELRRPSDSEGALAAAAKSLTTSAPDSEDVGKARTVAGLALLFQNKLAEAKAQFQAAKANPTYEAALAAKKQWATAADVGLQSVTDPLAAYRRPPVLPARDPVVAARALDAGITAFKAGRFKDAVAALTDATKADATDAVSWYFLGASKLALGQLDQGKDDIRQGAAREAVSNVPTYVVNAALSPIQGPARDAITAARP